MLPTFLNSQALHLFSKIGIDGIEQRSKNTNDVHLISGNRIGFWAEEHGLVLHPVYVEIQRFDNGDILKVGEVKIKDRKRTVLYGAYSISKRKFLFPTEFSLHEFWEKYSEL